MARGPGHGFGGPGSWSISKPNIPLLPVDPSRCRQGSRDPGIQGGFVWRIPGGSHWIQHCWCSRIMGSALCHWLKVQHLKIPDFPTLELGYSTLGSAIPQGINGKISMWKMNSVGFFHGCKGGKTLMDLPLDFCNEYFRPNHYKRYFQHFTGIGVTFLPGKLEFFQRHTHTECAGFSLKLSSISQELCKSRLGHEMELLEQEFSRFSWHLQGLAACSPGKHPIAFPIPGFLDQILLLSIFLGIFRFQLPIFPCIALLPLIIYLLVYY